MFLQQFLDYIDAVVGDVLPVSQVVGEVFAEFGREMVGRFVRKLRENFWVVIPDHRLPIERKAEA